MTRSCKSPFIRRKRGSSLASIRVLQHNPHESRPPVSENRMYQKRLLRHRLCLAGFHICALIFAVEIDRK